MDATEPIRDVPSPGKCHYQLEYRNHVLLFSTHNISERLSALPALPVEDCRRNYQYPLPALTRHFVTVTALTSFSQEAIHETAPRTSTLLAIFPTEVCTSASILDTTDSMGFFQ